MAVISKKDKLIEEAQKCATRGQFDKAAKAYEQILTLEPAATNLRQKLAELLMKCGRSDDARKELDTVGKYFSKNGFYLKAIAVYKQLQKLFPDDVSFSLTLAELNEKHGLIANALSEYKSVYDFYEKTGNIPESLRTLDRMQIIDPLSIPIKIKLAEAYLQNEKREESYAVFSKVVILLLARGDNTMLVKVRTRIQQLFPDKPDFMLDLLTDQVGQGNAEIAIESLQGLLRSNPDNKRVWDLVVQAYQVLNQPQRVKIAYQHYLNFFPAEPVAMLGVITSVTEEKDLARALELLDKYEAPLISAGFFQQLEQAYHALDKIDPISVRILEGLIRVATAAGKENDVQSLTSKLKSLHSVSGKKQIKLEQVAPPVFIQEQSLPAPEAFDASFFEESPPDELIFFENETGHSFGTVIDSPTASFDTVQDLGEEVEIDIEIDLDSPFGLPEQEINTATADDNWLDSVSDLFDSIDTAPRGVKFGSEMENSDAQSHFDLGQAFKEMGLYDEAITEFRQAAQDPLKRVECLIMQCVCLRERGELEKAIAMLQALLKPGLSKEEGCAVKYELATGYEATGNNEEACRLLNEIKAADPGFRDINSRLNAVNISDSLDFSDEDLDDFGL